MEMKLYDKIFAVANSQMQQHGMEFSFGKNAFDSILNKNPNNIHVEEFFGMQLKDFVDAVYLRCLNRLPDLRTSRKMNQYEDSTENVILLRKYLLLVSVSRSAEFKSLYKKIEGMDSLRTEVLKNSPFSTCCRLRASEVKTEVKSVVKKYFFMPVWNRFSLKKKMAIKAFVLREK